jgi:hypothetical protein
MVLGEADTDRRWGLPAMASGRPARSSARVYFINLHVEGVVYGGRSSKALRATVEIRGALGDAKLSRNYGAITTYCVTSSADGKLSLAVKDGPRS